MDLTYNEQQTQIKTTARDFFQDTCPMDLVRELEVTSPGYSPDIWRKMADLHWLGITFPEAYGGAGQGFLDLYALYEEMGRSLLPSPHMATVVLAGETLLRAGSEEQKQRLLPAIARGEVIIAPAAIEPNGAYPPEGVQMEAAAAGAAFRLNGTKLLVEFADSADYFLCLARAAQGITLFLVDRTAPGVSLESLPNISKSRLFAVTLDNVDVDSSALVGAVGGGWGPYSEAQARASVLLCAEVAGAGERVLDMAVTYAKDRVQFGRQVGSFQAVQYLCSDVAIEGTRSNLLGKQAAWRIDGGLTYEREAALASAAASKGIMHLTRQAHEVFAGIGFMMEHDMQMFTRRAKYWELLLGDPEYHKEAWAVSQGL